MSDLPELTIGVCTYKRPWYAIHSLLGFRDRLLYAGIKKFHIADGGSPAEDLDYYKIILKGCQYTIEVANNLSDMVNSCARHGGELWIVAMDDYVLTKPFDISHDARVLLRDSDIGVIRFSRLAYWGAGNNDPASYAQLIEQDVLHWWKLDRSRTKDPYMSSLGVHLYHRRFWDAYGDIPSCAANSPGDAELLGMKRFWEKPTGPTVAVPMRFGEDSADIGLEPFWHIGVWRTDDYAAKCGNRL